LYRFQKVDDFIKIIEILCESSRAVIYYQITITTIEPPSRASLGAPSMISLVPRIPPPLLHQVPTAETL
jgi:hypothetical protein